MDFVKIAQLEKTKEGLEHLLAHLQPGMDGLLDGGVYVSVPVALFVIEVAKRAEDRPEWFPSGKWATIQALQERCDQELDALFTFTEDEYYGCPGPD